MFRLFGFVLVSFGLLETEPDSDVGIWYNQTTSLSWLDIFSKLLKPWYSRFRIFPSLISCPLTWLWPCMGLCLKVLLESESPSRSLLSFCLLGLCGFVFPILWHDRDHLLMSVRPEPLLSFSLLGLCGFGFTVLWFPVFWHDCDRVLVFVFKSF